MDLEVEFGFVIGKSHTHVIPVGRTPRRLEIALESTGYVDVWATRVTLGKVRDHGLGCG